MTYTLFSALTASTLKLRSEKPRSVVRVCCASDSIATPANSGVPDARYHPTAYLLEVRATDGLAF